LLLLGVLLIEIIVWDGIKSNVAFKAATVENGMPASEVRRLMGEPKIISKVPYWDGRMGEDWQYQGPRKLSVRFQSNPLKVSMFESEPITIGFTREGKVSSVWIPPSD
jgi:hypothetical protein